MPSITDAIRKNVDKRIDNITDAGEEQKRALETFVDDLRDLEVVEGPINLGANTTGNLAKHFGVNYACNNKELVEKLERSVDKGEINPRNRVGRR